MQLRLFHASLLLLTWQVAPVDVRTDSAGRFRLAVGFGTGQYEERHFSCQGDLISAEPRGFTASGARLDAWPGDRLRFSAFGGVVSGEGPDYDGGFGGAALAYEGQRFGIGSGVTRGATSEGFLGPSFYLRLGNIDRAHLRLDALAPEAAFGATGWGRVGVAFNQGHLRRASGFAGASICPYCDEPNWGAFGQVDLPVTRGADVTALGRFRPGSEHAEWTAGAGLRYHFRR